MAGCKEKDKENLSDNSYIEFKDLEVKTVQNLVQGKWRVVSQSGGIAGTTEKITDKYIEFIGTNIWRTTSLNSITDLTITKWEKAEDLTFGGGFYLTLEKSVPRGILLVNLHNDTLYYNDALYDGYSNDAVRVK
jgi:hypothetical protein